MRLYITNDKEALVDLVNKHLSSLILEKKVELIINGTKRVGIVHSVALDEEKDFIVLTVNNHEEKIPVLDDTKARFGKELIVFETKNHSTVIEILE